MPPENSAHCGGAIAYIVGATCSRSGADDAVADVATTALATTIDCSGTAVYRVGMAIDLLDTPRTHSEARCTVDETKSPSRGRACTVRGAA